MPSPADYGLPLDVMSASRPYIYPVVTVEKRDFIHITTSFPSISTAPLIIEGRSAFRSVRAYDYAIYICTHL